MLQLSVFRLLYIIIIPWKSTYIFNVLAFKNDPCDTQCTKPPTGEDPKYTFDTAKSVESVLGGSFQFLRSDFFSGFGIGKGWGYIGAGLLDGSTGVQDSQSRDEAKWTVYELEKFISGVADFLVCEVKQIIGEYFNKYMEQADLDHYNSAINGLEYRWYSTCSARRCLNLTGPADKRIVDGTLTCCDYVGYASEMCEKANISDIFSGTAVCYLPNRVKYGGIGFCSIDRKCYGCYNFQQAIDDAEAILNEYAINTDLQWGSRLDKYSSVDAMSAYAKGTAFIMSIYQHLIMLGSGGKNYNEQYMSFTSTAASWLKSRLDYMLNIKTCKTHVNNSSYFVVPTYNEIIIDQNDIGVADILIKPSFKVRSSCGKGADFYMLWSKQSQFCGICTKKNNCTCQFLQMKDNDQPCPKQGSPNMCGEDWDLLEKSRFVTLKEESARKLQVRLTSALGSLANITAILYNISLTGIPNLEKAFGFFPKKKFYPMPSCNYCTNVLTEVSKACGPDSKSIIRRSISEIIIKHPVDRNQLLRSLRNMDIKMLKSIEKFNKRNSK